MPRDDPLFLAAVQTTPTFTRPSRTPRSHEYRRAHVVTAPSVSIASLFLAFMSSALTRAPLRLLAGSRLTPHTAVARRPLLLARPTPSSSRTYAQTPAHSPPPPPSNEAPPPPPRNDDSSRRQRKEDDDYDQTQGFFGTLFPFVASRGGAVDTALSAVMGLGMSKYSSSENTTACYTFADVVVQSSSGASLTMLGTSRSKLIHDDFVTARVN
jgi:hypothetical protein